MILCPKKYAAISHLLSGGTAPYATRCSLGVKLSLGVGISLAADWPSLTLKRPR